MNDLADKTMLVTGAGQGIGRAIAAAFATRGAKVWATDLNEAALDGLDCAERRKLDARDTAAVKAIIGEMGAVDILVNSVGFVHNGTVLECSEQDLDFAFDVNVKSMWRTISAVLPSMLERGEGCIINIASVAGSIKGVPNRFAYGTTKAAVVGLTKAVAADYVARGIRCNAICPGTVESPSLEQRLRAQGDYDRARAAFVARQPIGRIGTPEEIADLALYLATATYTTGQTHIIDGGWAN